MFLLPHNRAASPIIQLYLFTFFLEVFLIFKTELKLIQLRSRIFDMEIRPVSSKSLIQMLTL